MVLKTSITLSEDDFNTTTEHPNNTILVTLTGQGAAKTPLANIQEFLHRLAKSTKQTLDIKSTADHYRGEEACKVYFPLPAHIDINLLHGKALSNEGITYRAFIPGRTPTKIFLSFVPPTITDAGLQKLTAPFIDRNKIHATHRNINRRLDKHLIIAEIDNTDDIPHFIDLTDPRHYKTHRIHLTIPGRLPLCAECGGQGHYASQCSTKTSPTPPSETPAPPTETTPTSETPTPTTEMTTTEPPSNTTKIQRQQPTQEPSKETTSAPSNTKRQPEVCK